MYLPMYEIYMETYFINHFMVFLPFRYNSLTNYLVLSEIKVEILQ